MRLRDGLSVIAADFILTERIQEVFAERIPSPNIVYIALAGDNRYRFQQTQGCLREVNNWVSATRGCFNYISTTTGSEHHKRLIYHANVIILGSGQSEELHHNLKINGLGNMLEYRIAMPKPLILAGKSAGTCYLGTLDPSVDFWNEGNGKFVHETYHPQAIPCMEYSQALNVIPNACFMVHADDDRRRTFDCVRQVSKDHPGIAAFGLRKYAALLFEGDSVKRLGTEEVLIAVDGKVYTFD